MKYLLDTNVCITFLGQRNPILNKRFSSVPAQDKIVCSIVRAELYHGIYKSQRSHVNLHRIDSFLAHLPTLPFDDQAAQIHGVVRADLESKGTHIGSVVMICESPRLLCQIISPWLLTTRRSSAACLTWSGEIGKFSKFTRTHDGTQNT